MKMSWYLSGPISGDVDGNIAKFREAAEQLRALGYDIVSPVEVCDISINPDMKYYAWDWFMRRDIEAMLADEVKGLIYLPGCENSKGAKVEIYLANQLNYQVVSLEEALAVGERAREVEGAA